MGRYLLTVKRADGDSEPGFIDVPMEGDRPFDLARRIRMDAVRTTGMPSWALRVLIHKVS